MPPAKKTRKRKSDEIADGDAESSATATRQNAKTNGKAASVKGEKKTKGTSQRSQLGQDIKQVLTDEGRCGFFLES